MTAIELGNMIKNFCEGFGINDNQKTKSEDHCLLAGSENTRIGDNVENLSAILNTNKCVQHTYHESPTY